MLAQPPNLVANRYELLSRLGEGGMGVVDAAYDRLTGSRVALKRVPLAPASDAATTAGADGGAAADPTTASLHAVRLEGGRLQLGYRSAGRRDTFGDDSSEDWLAPAPEPISFAVPEVVSLGDRLLLSGDYAAAVATYALAEQSAGLGEMMQARRRQVLLSAASRQEEAEQLFGEAVRRSPQDGQARLALALLAGARGELAAAAERLTELGEETAGGVSSAPEERALALLAAARCLTVMDRPAAAATARRAQALLQAVADADAAVGGATRYRVPVMPSLDGNTVEMATEQTAFAENAVGYQATLGFIRGRVDTITRALKGD